MSRKRRRKERLRDNDPGSSSTSKSPIVSENAGVERIPEAFDHRGQAVSAANSENLIEYEPETASAAKSGDTVERRRPQQRSWRYEVVSVMALLVIWIPAIFFLRYAPPVYKSAWTIVIPGTTSGASISLDSLGEANTSVNSQYGGKSIDPKVNYKAIVLSSTVLEKAAATSGISLEEFGDPKVNLVDQTAMMEVIVKANDADTSRDKAMNLYNAFTDEVDNLRTGERIIKQNDSLQQLADYKLNVEKTQQALQDFRMNSEIVSTTQYKELLETVGSLTETKRAVETDLAAINARVGGLEYSLGVGAGVAGYIVKLRQDVLVQSQLKAYADAHAKMTEEEAVLGRKHPKVIHARSRTSLAYRALVKRADEVLDMDSTVVLNTLMPNEAGTDFALYTQLVTLHGDKAALESEVNLLDAKIPELREKVLRFADASARLEELERDHQIANTILVSATARLDLGKSDIYASYPMTQLLVPPNLPEKPGRLQKLFVLLGAVIGTFLVVLGLIILWNRKLWLRLIQKRG